MPAVLVGLYDHCGVRVAVLLYDLDDSAMPEGGRMKRSDLIFRCCTFYIVSVIGATLALILKFVL